MGAYSPAPVVTQQVHDKVIARVIQPVVDAMNANGTPYTGFLYAGLMIDDHNDPYVIEFNCRFGDPETQPIMMRLKGSMVDLIASGLDGNLPKQTEWDERPALGVVLASKGYPESASSGDVIHGLPTLESQYGQTDMDVKVFHAGTKAFDNGEIITNGGRVVCVTALGDDILDAQTKALATCGAISFDGMQYRRDIGWRAIQSSAE
jgi:phosphoribosylamine--glycine ligase